MANIINWPESQVCIGCVYSLFVMGSEPSQYVCEMDGCGGAECEYREDPRVTLHSAGYWWTCPQCKYENILEHEEWVKLGVVIQCNDCGEEFEYD